MDPLVEEVQFIRKLFNIYTFFFVILATPNLSGRDTPSSHISLDSSDRRTTSTNNTHSHTHDSTINSQSATTNNAHNPLIASAQRGPILPIVVQKPFREDVSDKFNLFDLPQQRPNTEAGTSEISMRNLEIFKIII